MESLSLFVLLTGILLLGFLAQWLAWRVSIPSIVFLFAGGLIVGPWLNVLSPDPLFGDLVFPVVSALIGIILFEGGLTLSLDDLGDLTGTVFKVILVGGTLTSVLTSITAFYLFEFSLPLSFLLGGILIVTGPTVVIPLLHQVRPEGDVGSIARWEGIIIDPLGAILAVIVFELVLSGVNGAAGSYGFGFGLVLFGESILVGGLIGVAAGYFLVFCFRRYWIPDYLHNYAIIATVLTAQALSNQILHESGLLAVTVMGMYLANQNQVTIRHILNFKEDLRVIFISVLFIILVARLDRSFLVSMELNEVVFLAVLVLVIRPVAIFLSTLRSELDWAERSFLAWIAPRGIVAAAVSSLFAYKLEQLGVENATHLADVTFFVIAGTVIIYGVTLGPLARLLGLSEHNPQGVLFAGAPEWVRTLARTLQEEGVRVRLVDRIHENVARCRRIGLDVTYLDVTTEAELQTLDIQGIGYFLAVTPNDEVNTLASVHALDLGFNRSEVFQLPPGDNPEANSEQPNPHRGRPLFSESIDFDELRNRIENGGSLEVIELEERTSVKEFRNREDSTVLPLFGLTQNELVYVLSEDTELTLQAGDRLVVLRGNNSDGTQPD